MATAQGPTFAELVRRYRRAAGLTQEELAERAALSARGIRALELGERSSPHKDTVQLLADALTLEGVERETFQEAARRAGGREQAGAIRVLDLPVGGFLGAVPDGPIVAREREIARVRATVEVVRGGQGRLLLLAGEPGVGKTRLAQEIMLIARAQGIYLAPGRCYEPQQAVAFYPFLEIASRLVAAARTRLDMDPVQRWPQLSPLLPDSPLVSRARLSGEDDQQRLFWAVAGLLQALARVMPIAVALDDLHWADQSSLELLQHVARQLRHAPVLLLGTYRDVDVQRNPPLGRALRDLHREHLAEEIAVGRLDQEGTGALMASTLGKPEVSSGLVERVHHHTEGNAFFVQEVVRALVARGQVRQRDQASDRQELGEISIPETVHEAIAERLAHLSEGTRTLLSEASVLGQTFGFDELQAMGDRAEQELEKALAEAADASVVRFGENDAYTFNHALTQQVLYRGLSLRRRKWLHLAAGNAIEQQPSRLREQRVAELAWHFLEGGEENQALRYATLAGDQAESRFAHREAEQQYRAALALVRESGEESVEAELLEKLGKAVHSAGRYDEALQILEQAAELHQKASDDEAEVRVAAHIGRVHANRGTSAEGIAYAVRMVEAQGDDPSPGMAGLHAALAALYLKAGRYSEQREAAERAAELARRFGNDEILAAAEAHRGMAFGLLGQVGRAREVQLAAVPLAERAGDLDTLYNTLIAIGDSYRMAGEFGQARLYRERALEVATRLSAPSAIAFALSALGQVYFLQGDWEAAGSVGERGVTIGASTESWHSAYPSHQLGELRLAQGQWDEASRLLETAVVLGERNRDMQALRMAHQGLAELDLLRGNPTAARERLQPLLDRPGLKELQVTPLLPILAQAELELGNADQAERILVETIRRAAAQGTRLETVDALRVRGVLLTKQRRWTDAQETFEQAASMAHAMPYPYAEARILYSLGLMHAESGAARNARARLKQALSIFRGLGARFFAEQAEQTLACLGAV